MKERVIKNRVTQLWQQAVRSISQATLVVFLVVLGVVLVGRWLIGRGAGPDIVFQLFWAGAIVLPLVPCIQTIGLGFSAQPTHYGTLLRYFAAVLVTTLAAAWLLSIAFLAPGPPSFSELLLPAAVFAFVLHAICLGLGRGMRYVWRSLLAEAERED